MLLGKYGFYTISLRVGIRSYNLACCFIWSGVQKYNLFLQ